MIFLVKTENSDYRPFVFLMKPIRLLQCRVNLYFWKKNEKFCCSKTGRLRSKKNALFFWKKFFVLCWIQYAFVFLFIVWLNFHTGIICHEVFIKLQWLPYCVHIVLIFVNSVFCFLFSVFNVFLKFIRSIIEHWSQIDK